MLCALCVYGLFKYSFSNNVNVCLILFIFLRQGWFFLKLFLSRSVFFFFVFSSIYLKFFYCFFSSSASFVLSQSCFTLISFVDFPSFSFNLFFQISLFKAFQNYFFISLISENLPFVLINRTAYDR